MNAENQRNEPHPHPAARAMRWLKSQFGGVRHRSPPPARPARGAGPARHFLRRRPGAAWYRTPCRAAALVLLSLAFHVAPPAIPAAEAQTNGLLAGNLNSSAWVSGLSGLSSTSWFAMPFSTGAAVGGYNLTEIVVDFDEVENGGAVTAALHRTFSPGSIPRPGAHVVDLVAPGTLVAGDNSFTPAAETRLLASAHYIVVFKLSAGEVEFERTASDNTDPGTATGWSFYRGLSYTSNSGRNWTGHTHSLMIAVNGSTNHPPTAADGTVTTNESTAHTFQADDFNFADTDTDDVLTSVTAVTLPSVGSLTLDGVSVVENQEVTAADIAANKLTFTPVTREHGAGYASFTFKVNDGTDDSSSAYTMTIDVTAVNEEATGAPTIAGTAAHGETLTASTAGIADVEGKTKADNGDAGYAYTYQWYRVEGSTATAIDRATASTYAPANDDVGKKLRVDVSFKDDDGSVETVPSAETGVVTGPSGLSIADASATEGNALAFTVTLAPAASEAVTVDYAASTSDAGDTASSADLSGTLSGTLTFDAGDLSRTIAIDTDNDNTSEGSETFTVTLSNASTQAWLRDATAVGTIEDDEPPPTVTLALTPDTIRESDDSTTPGTEEHQTTVTATLDRPSSADTTVAITPVAGAFTVSGALTIPAGQTDSTGTVTLTAVDNETDAPDRQVTVAATAANDVGAVDPAGVTLTIADDDAAPAVTLVLTPDTIREFDDSTTPGIEEHKTTVTATLDRPSSADTTVTVSAAPVAPAVAGDFQLSTDRQLTIPAGQRNSTGTVTITAQDNATDTPDRQVTVSGTATNSQGRVDPADVTLTITDEDAAPTVTLVLTPDTIRESDDSTTPGIEEHKTTITATLDRLSSADTTVTVSAAPVGPAVAGDFQLSTDRQLTIPAGQRNSTGTVTITAQDNATDAPDRQVTVSGTATNSQGRVNPGDVTLTIADDDTAPTVTLVLTPDTIRESDDSTTPGTEEHKTTVTATLDRPSSADTTVAITPVAGAFTVSGALTIPAGQTDSTGTATLTAVDNATDAPNRQVTVAAAAANDMGAVDPAGVTLTIADEDDAPVVTLTLTPDTIRESDDSTTPGIEEHKTTVTATAGPAVERGYHRDGRGADADAGHDPRIRRFDVGPAGRRSRRRRCVTATLDRLSSADTTVTVSAAPVGPAVAGDFELSTDRQLTIPAGQRNSTGTVTLTAVDNTTDAPDKGVTVSGTAANSQGKVNPADVTLTIRDDEGTPKISLSLTPDTIRESDDSTTPGTEEHKTTVTATLTVISSADTTVTITPVAGAFTVSGALTIPAGQTDSTGTATLTAVDNATDAPNRQVTVAATAANNMGAVDPAGVTLTIADDDAAPVVALVLTPDTIRESDDSTTPGIEEHKTTVTATLDRLSSADTTVTVSAAPVDPAVAGDFELGSDRLLTIPAGQRNSTGTVTIAARDNDTDAPDKGVTVSGTATNGQGRVNPADVTLTIRDDDDGPAVRLALSRNSTSEDDDTAIEVTASLSHPSNQNTAVTISAAAVSPAQATDFTLSGNRELTIAAGTTTSTGTVTIAPVDNETDSPARQVRLSGLVDNGQGYEAGTPAEVTLDITDDDPAPVATLVLTPPTIGESGGVSTVKARLDRPSSEDTTVTVSAAAVSPTVPGDFELSTGTALTITAGMTTSTGTVTIAARDNATAAPERQVRVSATASNSHGIGGADNTPGTVDEALADETLTIEDDELPPTVILVLTDRTIRESDDTRTTSVEEHKTTLKATLSHPSSAVTTVTINAVPDGFTLSRNTLTIARGATDSASATLTAVDNTTDAPDRVLTAIASATNARGPGNIVQPAGVELTIEDEDAPPTVTLRLTPPSIGENGGTTQVAATLSHPSSAQTTVTVSAAAVSPATDGDFTLSSSVLVIPAGATAASDRASIRAEDDDTDAPDKEVTVSATVDNTQGYNRATPADVTLTIEDDEEPPTVTLHLSETTIGENGGEATVTARLSRPSSEATAVTVMAAALSPAVAADFTLTGSALTIAKGVTGSTGTVTIAANDNDVDAANKSVRVSATAQNNHGVVGNSPAVTLTLADDDERGFALSPAALTTREGTDIAYQVALTAQPTGAVTVTVSATGTITLATADSPQDTDFGASKTLTFTTSNWQIAQPVTLRAGADSNQTDDTHTIGHSASGGGYGSVRGTLSLRVLDVQKTAPALVLTVDRATIPEDGGPTLVSVTATLGGHEPAQVSVALTVNPGTAASEDYTANGTSFEIGGTYSYNDTFRTSRDIAITPVNDGLDEGDETVIVTATVSGVTVVPAIVTIVDDDTRGVTITPERLVVAEGSSRDYEVVLNSQPTGTVTVRLSRTGDSDITVSPISLTFDADDWSTAQTVTVAADEDADPLNDSASISHAVSGADYGRNDVRAAAVQVTADDNDGRGVTITPLDLSFAEGGRDTYAVVLNSEPSGAVTIRPVVSGDDDVSVSPASLTFGASNWETAKTVTVEAQADADPTDDRASISHTVTGADYGANRVSAPEVRVTVRDRGDMSGAATLSVSSETLQEAASRTIVLTATLDGPARPTATELTVLVRGGTAAVSDFQADPAAFRLTIPANDTSGTARFELRAVGDDVDEDSETVLVSASAANFSIAEATITIEDDDEKGITVSRDALDLTEQGDSGTYTVRLNSEPTGEVIVTPTVTGDTDVTVDPPSITYTASNWRTAREVTVQAVSDPDGDDEHAEIGHAAQGADYTGFVSGAVAVSVTDDDETSRKVILGLSPERVDEDMATQLVTVSAMLDGAARVEATDVAVTVAGGTASPGTDFTTVQGFTITIPEGHREATRSFGFTPVNDNRAEADETLVVDGTTADLTVDAATLTLVDDDEQGVTRSVQALTVDEENDGTYTLVLDTEPSGNVTVNLSVDGNSDVTISPPSLTFKPNEWYVPQEVTVAAAADDDAGDDTATVRHSAGGADYGRVQVADMTVTVRDTDTRGVTLSALNVQVREGGRKTYTVVLDTQPTGTVTVTPALLAGSDGDVRVSPSALSFTSANWNRPKSVTVSADQDDDVDPDAATIEHGVSGADYGETGTTARPLFVTVTDDDVPSREITLEISALEVREGAGTTSLTVTAELDAMPANDAVEVSLALEHITATEGEDYAAIQPVTLTIPAGEVRATAQVPVAPVQDEIDEGAGETLRIAASTNSSLALVQSEFLVTIVDDDQTGLVLSRDALRVPEDGSQTYTVKLRSRPTAAVAVFLFTDGPDSYEVTPDPAELQFTTDNWNTAQTVRVMAAADPDGDDDTATVTHAAPGYHAGMVDLPVTVDDDDQMSRSVQLSLSSERVDESAGSQQVTMTATLDAAARHADTEVAVRVTGGTAAAGDDYAEVLPFTVTIPADRKSGSAVFDLAPVNDNSDEGLGETVIFGGDVQDLRLQTATLTIADDDGRGITLSRGPVTLTEEDASGTYTVALATEPTGTVTVRITVSGNSDVTVAPSELTFDRTDWSQAKTVQVSSAHDDDAVPDTAELHHAASGADYRSVTALPQAVQITDNDVPGVTVSASTLDFREGGQETYTVVLDTQPTDTVTVRPSATGDESITASPASLTFTQSDWNTPKKVTVRAEQDADQTADSATISHSVSGADYGDAGVTAQNVSVLATDDDIPSTEIRLAISADTVAEDGGPLTLTVTGSLDAAPETTATTVMLSIEAGTAQAGVDFEEAAPVTLTILQGAASGTARLTLTPIDDAIDTDDLTVRLAATTTSHLQLDPSSFDLTITDNDERGVTVMPAALTILEGETATYKVALGSQPTADVTVDIASDYADVTVDPPSLMFAAAEWDTVQTVTVRAADDDQVEDEATPQLTHTVSGGDYGSVTAAPVAVTVPGFEQDGNSATFRIPSSGQVTVPDGTPVMSGTRLTVPVVLTGAMVKFTAANGEETRNNSPSGFSAGGTALEIELIGATFPAGQSATVCVPVRGHGRIHRYDSASATWIELEEPTGSLPAGLACGLTERFSLFAVTSTLRDRVAKGWLARFGRTLVQHVVDAVQDRISASRGAGVRGRLAGQELPVADGTAFEDTAARRRPGLEADPLIRRMDHGVSGGHREFSAESREITPHDLLIGSGFTAAGEGADGSSLALWGRGAVTRFEGRDGEAALEGDVETAMLGADWARGPLMTGLMLALSRGEGAWQKDGQEDEITSRMASVHPYVGYKATERLTLWGVVGYGRGGLTLPERNGKVTTDIEMTMGAVGARGDLISRGAGSGLALALNTDALLLRISSDATDEMNAVEADVSRLRVGFEGSLVMAMGGGMTLTPVFEAGVRRDDGDAETGFGVDVTAGLDWSDPRHGIEARVRARGLLAHDDSGFRERGFSGSLTWDPQPTSERGFSLSVSPSLGAPTEDGVDALFAHDTLADLAGDDDGGRMPFRVEATLGYGLPAFGNRFISIPEIGVGFSDTYRDYSLGWRLSLMNRDDIELDFDVRATRREHLTDRDEAEHGINFLLTVRH